MTKELFSFPHSPSETYLIQGGVTGGFHLDHSDVDRHAESDPDGLCIRGPVRTDTSVHSLRHAMDYHGVVRIGTNLPDKKVFMNLRRMVADIQAKNGGQPITDTDRQAIAVALKVKIDTVKRMEPRVFSSDIAVAHTDVISDDEDQSVSASGVISVPGEQAGVEADMDQRDIMARIHSIVQTNFDARDLEIVQARLTGDMTREKFDVLVDKHGISVERIRQIQRAALLTIREGLQREGITGMNAVSI